MSYTSSPSASAKDIVSGNPSSRATIRQEQNGQQNNRNKNRRLFLSVAIAVWVPSLLYTFLVFQPKYESRASVLVRDSAIKAKFVTNDVQETTSSPSANPVLNTSELLKSNVIRDNLWQKMISTSSAIQKQLDIKTQEDWNAYYGDGHSILKSNNPPGTDVIQLSLVWNDPALARRALELTLEGFQNASRELNQNEHQERYQYLQKRIDGVKAQLVEQRKYISHWKSENNITNIDNELENYAKYHLEYKIAASLAQADSAQNQEKLSSYRNALKMDPTTAVKAVGLGGNPNMKVLFDKLYSQKEQLATLKARYTSENTKVKELESSVQQTQGDIKGEANRLGLSGNIPIVADEARGKAIENMLEANSMAQGGKRRSSILSGNLNKFEKRMRELPKIEQNLKTLQEQDDYLSESLKSLEGKAMDELIREDQTLSNVFIINPPTLPSNSKAPTKMHMLVLSIIAGLMAGLVATKLLPNRKKIAQSVTSFSSFWPTDDNNSTNLTEEHVATTSTYKV